MAVTGAIRDSQKRRAKPAWSSRWKSCTWKAVATRLPASLAASGVAESYAG